MTDIIANALSAKGLAVGYGGTRILSEIDLEIPDGKITALIGANGSGKSTLLRAFGRILQPHAGSVLLDGRSIARLPAREVARKLALLPQSPVSPDGLTVRRLCRFGRHPHKGFLSRSSRHDEDIVEEAIAAVRLSDLSERPLDLLSGGQKQRAWIAMALAQQTPILLLDEPTTYLDIAHQLEVLDLLKELNRKRDRTIVMILHDLNQASQFADHLIAIADGQIRAAGNPANTLTPQLIKEIFGIDSLIIPHPIDGSPLCLPRRSFISENQPD